MNNKHIAIKKRIEAGETYEKISSNIGVSLGTISKVNKMKINLEEYKIQNAVIWAAGWGSRLMPVTTNTPKPLVEANGVSLIETIIQSLKRSGIKNISIVLGRQKEKFYDLIEKHDLDVIINKKWEKHNNISSYYAAIKKIKGNVYLIDGDLFIKDDFIFPTHARESFAFSSFNEDSNDIVFNKKGRYISSLSIPSKRANNISGEQYKGIFMINKFDSKTLNNAIKEEYDINNEYEGRYWFDILFNDCIGDIKLDTEVVSYEDIYEVDNISDLIHIDRSYSDWKDRKW